MAVYRRFFVGVILGFVVCVLCTFSNYMNLLDEIAKLKDEVNKKDQEITRLLTELTEQNEVINEG